MSLTGILSKNINMDFFLVEDSGIKETYVKGNCVIKKYPPHCMNASLRIFGFNLASSWSYRNREQTKLKLLTSLYTILTRRIFL